MVRRTGKSKKKPPNLAAPHWKRTIAAIGLPLSVVILAGIGIYNRATGIRLVVVANFDVPAEAKLAMESESLTRLLLTKLQQIARPQDASGQSRYFGGESQSKALKHNSKGYVGGFSTRMQITPSKFAIKPILQVERQQHLSDLPDRLKQVVYLWSLVRDFGKLQTTLAPAVLLSEGKIRVVATLPDWSEWLIGGVVEPTPDGLEGGTEGLAEKVVERLDPALFALYLLSGKKWDPDSEETLRGDWLNKAQEALALLRGSVISERKDVHHWFQSEEICRAIMLSGQTALGKDDDTSLEFFDLAANECPRYLADAQFGLGAGLMNKGSNVQAEGYFQSAAKLDLSFFEPRLGLAEIAWSQGRLADAEEALRAALVVSPNSSVAHESLGEILFESGRVPESEMELQQAARILEPLVRYESTKGLGSGIVAAVVFPSSLPRIYSELARSQLTMQNQEAAISNILRASKMYEARECVCLYVAAILIGVGRTEEAKKNLGRAILLNPDFEIAREYLTKVRRATTSDGLEIFHRLPPLNCERSQLTATKEMAIVLYTPGHSFFDSLDDIVQGLCEDTEEGRIAEGHLRAGDELSKSKGMAHFAVSHYRYAMKLHPPISESERHRIEHVFKEHASEAQLDKLH